MDDKRTGFQPGEVIAGGGIGHVNQPASQPLTSSTAGTGAGAGVVRFKLDGVVKSMSGPFTGARLHQLAGAIDGFPAPLKSNGVEVPNTDEPFEVKTDQEFTTK